jgi:predicted lipid-binding transport protein (Tim44 family)
VFDIYTIIFLALAVFIFLRLRSVLGQRTGRERPPYDPYSAPDPIRNAANDKVIPLPSRTSEGSKAVEVKEGTDRYAGIASPGSAVARGLDAIGAVDKSFDARHFVTRRPFGLRDDRHRLCRGRPPGAQGFARARGL